jgi:hypothetical protein
MFSYGSLFLLAILSGISFSLIGIALRLGSDHEIHPLHIVAVSSLMGVIVFAIRLTAHFGEQIPVLVFALGALAGVSQYVVLHAFKWALNLGPLSPLWCALMLSFIPVILYVGWFRGETVAPVQYGAVGLAVVCVLIASMGQRKDPGGTGRLRPRTRWRALEYGVVLLAVLLLNSIANICMKELGITPSELGGTYMSQYGAAFFATLYLCVQVCVMTDNVVTRRRPGSFRWMLILGALTGVGSIGGLWLLEVCIELPAAVLFTVNSISSILFTCLIGAFYFREPKTLSWYATIATAVVVVLLARA